LHARWNGFTVYDLIMPLFLFVVGASMPLAFASRIGPGRPLQPLYWRIARRVALLWSFGIVFQYMKQLGDGDTFSLELYSNTLQAIAVGYLVTSLALLHLRVPGQVVLLVSLVIGYWTLLVFVPFGGHPAGTLEQKANFARYIDVSLLGDYRRDHHFTWVATSLGFTASVLLGAMAGQLLRARLSVPRRLVYLVLLGCSSLLGGWIWSYSHPFNRHLWTSSMILWSGGWSFLLLAFFYLVMDVAKVRAWAYPFLVIGANALLAYMLDIFFYWVLDRIWADVLPVGLSAAYTSLVTSAYEVALLWLILWWLYRRGLFLRA
jgi:predicted acyltransferase